MRAEFRSEDDPNSVVGSATWTAEGVDLEPTDEAAGRLLRRIFRSAPVSVEEPALRTAGTTGPVVLQPGSLRWFMAAAKVRGGKEGLAVRMVPEGEGAMGWDPAAAYRTFSEAMERKERIGTPARMGRPEAGEARPEGERGPAAPGTEAAKPAPRPSASGPSG